MLLPCSHPLEWMQCEQQEGLALPCSAVFGVVYPPRTQRKAAGRNNRILLTAPAGREQLLPATILRCEPTMLNQVLTAPAGMWRWRRP